MVYKEISSKPYNYMEPRATVVNCRGVPTSGIYILRDGNGLCAGRSSCRSLLILEAGTKESQDGRDQGRAPPEGSPWACVSYGEYLLSRLPRQFASPPPRAGSSPPILHRVRPTAKQAGGRGCHVPAYCPSTGWKPDLRRRSRIGRERCGEGIVGALTRLTTLRPDTRVSSPAPLLIR